MNIKKSIFFLLIISILSFISVIYVNRAASFQKYAPKLLKFEGKGYGIHQPIWGNKIFTKEEALYIHKHYYWNKYHGNRFKSQAIAEVLIDHLINAGEGKGGQNIIAFEKIIGVNPDAKLSISDVNVVNQAENPNEITNAYVEYRLRYYRSLKGADKNSGWMKRAKSFYVEKPEKKQEPEENITEDYIVLPASK